MKKMVIGLMIGLTIGYAASAYAAVGDTVSAVFAEFSYIVNGTDKAIDSPVLVYDGASYVRTTDIANLLGFDVTYKADSRTIAFNNGATPTPIPMKASISSLTVTDTTYTPTPSPTPDPSATPDPNVTPTPTPSPTVTPSPTPTVTPTPAPNANYPGYNAALSRLKAEVVDKNNKLYADWDHTYHQYEGTVTAQIAYDNMQGNIKTNNDQMELDILALKFQYNIPAQYNP